MNFNFERGARVWVKLGSKKEAGILLDFGDSAEGDYMACKVELLKVNTLVPGQLLRQVYSQLIQSYKLTKRFDSEILPGEVQA